ncbi:hypothetical protein Tsubulata_030326 [Turnera subulata]|uniref:Pentacotripeptide-repeat region of PRORP domain-containing protein n=1 Tax=Turnera subulata TaxID=218843 RepID=A0A9Q0JR31_9ROSI|nr:hypothetical protein Tsubulata_030326 [Turnera subulata]
MRNISNTLDAGLARRALAAGLDYALYGRLLKHFTERRLPWQGKQLHARLAILSTTRDNFLTSKLINLYGKTDHFSYARQVFDQIPCPNTFSYNALLIACSINNRHTQTLEVFWELACSGSPDVMPDNYSVTCLLKSLSGSLVSCVRLGKEVHGFAIQRGYDVDVFVGNSLISYYSKCEDLVSARKLFDGMREKDVVTWNSMIAGYSQAGLYEECKDLYREMVRCSGFKPNGVTMACVLQACGQSSDLHFGMEVHRFAVDEGVPIDVSAGNALIALYAKCGSLDYARELFEEMGEKDEVAYGSLISGYMLHGFVDEGMKLFREMKSRGLSTWNALLSGLAQNNQHDVVMDLVREMHTSGFRPNTVTLASVLPTLSYFSNLRGGKEVHCYAIKNNFDRNIYVATAIIDTYAKSGFLGGARKVFDRSKDRSLIIWTAIISAYSAHGDANSAVSLFEEMLNNQIQPDSVTFTAVLGACTHCGAVDKAWEIFNSMSKKFYIEPSSEHYACMTGVLSRAGRLSEAVEFVSEMPMEPDAKIWGALHHGASLSGDVEVGKFTFDHLINIEPENTGNYIIMANLYSQAGRRKEADDIRERMNQMGLKKIPGISWIETSKGLRSFIAIDSSCGETDEIYGMLEGLAGLMREETNAMQDEFDEFPAYV